jgi:hypothetical protein
MAGEICTRCGADATVMISTVEHDLPLSRPYCETCWRVARYEAGPIMSEGPLVWGEDWSEVEMWLARNLRSADERPNSRAWRQLAAHYLRQQLPHLPTEIPQSVATFLREFDDAAG